jgi:hypothetical protein
LQWPGSGQQHWLCVEAVWSCETGTLIASTSATTIVEAAVTTWRRVTRTFVHLVWGVSTRPSYHTE